MQFLSACTVRLVYVSAAFNTLRRFRLVLDCCQSGSGTRGGENENDQSTGVRGCGLRPYDIPEGLDQDILKANPQPKRPAARSNTRDFELAKGFAVKDMHSHILLAACSGTELAREEDYGQYRRGPFTVALLELLKRVPPKPVRYFGSYSSYLLYLFDNAWAC